MVTAKLICVFVFVNAICWFSHDGTQVKNKEYGLLQALPPTQTSPTPRRVPVERKTSPKISSSFPSKSSFHANEASPRKQIKGDSPRKLTRGEDPVRTSSAMVQTVEAAQERQSRRRNQLNVATSCKWCL